MAAACQFMFADSAIWLSIANEADFENEPLFLGRIYVLSLPS